MPRSTLMLPTRPTPPGLQPRSDGFPVGLMEFTTTAGVLVFLAFEYRRTQRDLAKSRAKEAAEREAAERRASEVGQAEADGEAGSAEDDVEAQALGGS